MGTFSDENGHISAFSERIELKFGISITQYVGNILSYSQIF